MVAQMRDSAMLAADLSYLERNRTGSLLEMVSMAVRKIWAKSAYIDCLPSVGSFAGLLFGPEWDSTFSPVVKSAGQQSH
jgi:hypothetical protein